MTITKRTKSIFSLLWEAIRGSEQNFTEGSINRAIVLLSVPMILEMAMEGVFAVADIYFVGKLGDNDAVTTVGLTESMLAIVYSLGMGLSMGATAMVARRIGEKDPKAASIAAVQTLYIGFTLSLVISIVGLFYSKELLAIMGANQNIIDNCSGFTKGMLVGNITIVFLFLINGIFRGAGNASIAMWTLVVSNGLNILLDPIFIFGWGPIPAFGVEGAAIATNIGRGSAVAFQLYYLFSGRGIIKIHKEYFKVLWDIIGRLISVAAGSTMQFLIGSASWIFLYRIMTSFGSEAAAGYTFAIRVIVFAILPAWGMANAAATLVGQNLGAGNPDRAERSVYRTALFNTIFLGVVTVVFYTLAGPILELFTKDPIVIQHGTQCLKIVSLGYMFYAYGMVVNQSFNGAGDTRTPTIISFFGFWIFQIPLAYALAYLIKVGPIGVYSAIAIAESLMAIAGIIIFRMGKWKTVKI